MKATPISESKALGCGRPLLIAFGSLFFLAGTVAFWFTFIVPLRQTLAARSWAAAPCTVVAVEIETHRSDDGTTYSPKITYEYTVAGETYRSDRRRFLEVSSSRSWAQEVLKEFPVGSETVCYYDPEQPSEAVLQRDFSWSNLFGLFTLLFIIVGGAIMWYGLFRYGQQNVRPVSSSTSVSMAAAHGQRSRKGSDDRLGEGPRKLRPASTRWGRFLLLLVAALFWNGIVSVFLWVGMNEEAWWLYLFLTPFVLVGLGLIVGVGHQFLSLWNPIVEIGISNAAVPLGSQVDVAWQTEGNVARIRRLVVSIVGTEKATYTRGTSTYTDTEVFLTIEVANTEAPEQMRFGTATVTIPIDTMHSFQANNNEIVWTIRVKGDIARWPDINEEFPFRVRPRKR
ncbi:MAG: hypothetical protein KatS3mg111_0496 [Pirellulaceae bacterium]|nr:MAG: hypothetical protein KatS3mg111_0496 [Pirellulaceae bacterium]